MNRTVLLVEPDYRSKYPPLGLMKIAQYHKKGGDKVEFTRGMHPDKLSTTWDRIYVSSLFTYDWAKTIRTLQYYRASVKRPISENLVVGGVLATLMADDIRREIGCKVVRGLLDENGKLGYEDDACVDGLLPDYSILDSIDYKYATSNAYFAYATRGCIRHCPFCAVPRIEPRFQHYVPIREHIREVQSLYGPKRDLVLLDNNVLASNRFADIVQDIKDAGFARGATYEYKGRAGTKVAVRRRVDFNQGIDIRLLDDSRMALLSQIAIEPLRLAFDSIADRDLYEEKVRLSARYGVRHLSNYILFNYEDWPEDLYSRLRLNVELNSELGLQIFSFPMRYASLDCRDRLATTPGNIGLHWNRKYLRAIQCILVRTRGIVSHRLDYFKRAFGNDIDEFRKILLMPEPYIIHRADHEKDRTAGAWWWEYSRLGDTDQQAVLDVLLDHSFKKPGRPRLSEEGEMVLRHYNPKPAGQMTLLSDGDSLAQASAM